MYIVRRINSSYLGDKTNSKEACDGMFSVTARREKIRCRSLKALPGSPLRLALASSGLRAKRRGTGPLACSPSNMSQCEFHSAARTVGTASLDKSLNIGLVLGYSLTLRGCVNIMRARLTELSVLWLSESIAVYDPGTSARCTIAMHDSGTNALEEFVPLVLMRLWRLWRLWQLWRTRASA
jgi:hypothetical protein